MGLPAETADGRLLRARADHHIGPAADAVPVTVVWIGIRQYSLFDYGVYQTKAKAGLAEAERDELCLWRYRVAGLRQIVAERNGPPPLLKELTDWREST
jgi:hypothetical protein